MVGVVEEAGREKHLALFRAHPDLAGRLAQRGELTPESTREQAAAGLAAADAGVIERIRALNDRYRQRFGFPFIICARLNHADAILRAMESRLENDPERECRTALEEIAKIARLRLADLVAETPASGKLTTHVLDTAQGRPAAGVRVVLKCERSGGAWEVVTETVTNADGRTDAPLVAGERLTAGLYEIEFHIGSYFPGGFFDMVPIRFRVADAGAHYHVPLLCSPWSYSTYRGS